MYGTTPFVPTAGWRDTGTLAPHLLQSYTRSGPVLDRRQPLYGHQTSESYMRMGGGRRLMGGMDAADSTVVLPANPPQNAPAPAPSDQVFVASAPTGPATPERATIIGPDTKVYPPLPPQKPHRPVKCDPCRKQGQFLPTWQGVAGIMYILVVIALIIVLISQWSNWVVNLLWLLILLIVVAALFFVLAILTFYYRPCNNQLDVGCNKTYVAMLQKEQDAKEDAEYAARQQQAILVPVSS